MPTSKNKYASNLTRPSTTQHTTSTISRPSSLTPDEIFNFLTHLIAMNGHSAATEVRQKPNAESIPESSPKSPAPTESSESNESSEPTSESQKSTSSSPDDTDTDTYSTSSDAVHSSQISTASNRTLQTRLPITKNETLLQCLHRRPQIRTLHNVSIPLPDCNNKETQETDENTWEDTDKYIQEDIHEDTNVNTQVNELFKHYNCKTYIWKAKINYFRTIVLLYYTATLFHIKIKYFRTPVYQNVKSFIHHYQNLITSGPFIIAIIVNSLKTIIKTVIVNLSRLHLYCFLLFQNCFTTYTTVIHYFFSTIQVVVINSIISRPLNVKQCNFNYFRTIYPPNYQNLPHTV